MPGARGALHCGQDGKIARLTKVRITDRPVVERHLPQIRLLTVPAGAAKEVHLRARRPMRQIQLQVGITSVDVLMPRREAITVKIAERVLGSEPTVTAIDSQTYRQRR